MSKQRKVVITVTYNEMGIIVGTKVEELGSSAQPENIRCKDCKYHDENGRMASVGWLPCMECRKENR